MTTADPADASGHPRRLVWAALLVLTAPVLALAAPQRVPLALGMLVAGGLLAWLAWQGRDGSGERDLLITRPWALAVLAVPGALQVAVLTVSSGPALRLVIMAGYVLAAATAVAVADLEPLGRLTSTRLFVLAQAAIFAWVVPNSRQQVDVWVFLRDGAHAVLHGVNPYAITFPNLYPPDKVPLLYGPGVVVDGRVTYGFPYPPVSVLWAVPGHLLGDVRISGIIALSVLAWVLSGPMADRQSRALAVLFLVAPSAVVVITSAWIEPLLVVLLGLAVWGMKTGRLTVAALSLGLFLASKQYLVVALPCLWLLRPLATRRRVGLVVGAAAVVTLPFFLANPHAFWRSVVEWQLRQPFRPDSLSLLVASVNHFGWPTPVIYNVLPITAGLLVAAVFSLTSRPGPAQFATGVGLSLLATVLLSKQAFVNYYFLIGAAFLVAAWAAVSPQRSVQSAVPVSGMAPAGARTAQTGDSASAVAPRRPSGADVRVKCDNRPARRGLARRPAAPG